MNSKNSFRDGIFSPLWDSVDRLIEEEAAWAVEVTKTLQMTECIHLHQDMSDEVLAVNVEACNYQNYLDLQLQLQLVSSQGFTASLCNIWAEQDWISTIYHTGVRRVDSVHSAFHTVS